MPGQWLIDATAALGDTCKKKLAGPGEPEAAIRAPIEELLAAAGQHLSLTVVPHDEVRDNDRGVRPDYAISVNGAITGYVEIKKPGANLDPESFTGHNLTQWQRQRDLPNLIYTNGTEWRLYRDNEQVGDPVHLTGGTLRAAGSKLTCGDNFEHLLNDFLRWKPAPITGVIALVKAVAPLCRLLRGEVLDQLDDEKRAIAAGARESEQPFHGLARDWRALLFPTAGDEVFADGYAQAVTFALLLARTENIDLENAGGLHNVGVKLAGQHSLMSRALQLLTDYVAADFKVTLDLLVRVVGAVDWPKVRAGNRDTYLHLYERFLEEYDPDLRRLSGSYYTPHQVIEQMVRLAEDVLVERLHRPDGFADPTVVVADPAAGTGGYLQQVIEHVAKRVEHRDGQGAVAGAVSDLAARLYGFELQMGPFAVAELRVTDLLADVGASLPERGLGLFVTDTLDDPYAEQTQLGSGLELISRSRSRAAKVKAKTQVTVVIGNPPYRERAEGMGRWIENGSGADPYKPLDDFRAPGNGRAEFVLKNLYVYFWRWGTWKVFDANANLPGGDVGIVCYISTSGYLRGPGFKGMREYLRRNTSEGWIIDVSPEGQRPEVATRIFPGVQQPLAIALFTRTPDCDGDIPATIHYTAVHGRRADKYQALADLTLTGLHWRQARTNWQAPFTPSADTDWDDYPALNDLFPWTAPGVKPNRKWIYAPDQGTLRQRLKTLIAETDPRRKAELFKETDTSHLDTRTQPLGPDSEPHTDRPFASEKVSHAAKAVILRSGYRFLDRQWIIADRRLIDRSRPELWAARLPNQIFTIELHSKPITNGPGVVFSSLIPDNDHFRGSHGGRTLPLYHPGGRPNLASGLLGALSTITGAVVTAEDLIAYVAGVAAHPAYTDEFVDELTTPGIRIPITTDASLFQRAIELGREIVWLHTYGDRFAEGRRGIRYASGDPRRITNQTAVSTIPTTITYDAETATVHIGSGTFGPVPQEVWDYTIDDKPVVNAWFNYRKANPTGRRTSPLDEINATTWPAEWNGELIDLLTVLARLVELHPAQAELLHDILDRPVASYADLASAGVTWPTTSTDAQRRPDYTTKTDHEETGPGQLGFTFGTGE
ncbi:type ISP restriction/modification enzyme [Mycobacterium sp. IDR2000157661]|uniref:type ISP restriction/modification enzyme n=1 Tax=Mycobacterium sp. IDR2000157661 TaxID=2867005 RepID=UPI001EEBF786|nr:type ISP restriction/modification enzyme [Mycobacterium sp. IDR2000157661]